LEEDMTEFLSSDGGQIACEVTGLTAAAEQVVASRPELVWDLVADITRIGGWSPECIRAAWLGEPGRPQPGARFTGHNRFPNGFEYEVTCVVTEADRPRAFAWAVLDDSGDPARPRRGGTGSTRSPAAAAPSGSASPTDPAPATCGQPPRRRRTGPLRLSLPGGTGCGPT
jgi:hypothetical protein